MKPAIRLFISHSADDSQLVERLVELIRAAMNLPASAIRCSSVDGYRLPGGADTDEQLRHEVHDSEAFIGIVSPASVRSMYVLFELGARWGAGKPLVPILAPGAGVSTLGGPLAGLNALCGDNRAQLHQLLQELGSTLSLSIQSPAVFEKYLNAVAASSGSAHLKPDAEPAMTFKAPFWYKENDGVPHCPRCWEVDGRAIHLHGPIKVAAGTRFDCVQCEQLFIAERTGST